ncbi:MAG: hypothetical protein CMD83_17870 [Gammaproteobacteria bacterium]|nr:hypothetical protein [Gammaproteobacteria bacterium]
MKKVTIPKEQPFAEELKDPQVGDLVKLYNLYTEIIVERPSVIGLYMGSGRSGQFSYYEIHVLKDNESRGFIRSDTVTSTQRYLINDFIMCKFA